MKTTYFKETKADTPMRREMLRIYGQSFYDEARNKAYAYVFRVLGSGWFNPEQVKNNEGGVNAMVDDALSYIMQHESIKEGLKAYGGTLSYYYNINRLDNTNGSIHHPVVMESSTSPTLVEDTVLTLKEGEVGSPEGTEGSLDSFGESASLVPEGLYIRLNINWVKVKLKPDVIDMLNCYMATGSWAETERLLGLPRSTRQSRVRAVRRKVTQVLFNQGDNPMATAAPQPG